MVWISLTFGRALGRLVLHGIAAITSPFAAARPARQPRLPGPRPRPLGRVERRFRHVLSLRQHHPRPHLPAQRPFRPLRHRGDGAERCSTALARQPGRAADRRPPRQLRGAARGRPGQGGAQGDDADVRGERPQDQRDAGGDQPGRHEDIIALGRMDSMLQARDRLDQGYLVGMLADRGLGDDADASIAISSATPAPSRSGLCGWRRCCAGRSSS